MPEVPQTVPSQGGGSSHRGRGGRGGRGYRGGPMRGRTQPEPGRPNNIDAAPSAPTEVAPTRAPEPRVEPPRVPTEHARDGQSGRSRGDGGRGRGGLRRGRGSSNQRSIVVSHRARPGPQTQDSSPAGLSAAASEFIPGQPVQTAPQPRQRAPRPTPRKAIKSTAEDLPTRIHEDIDNSQYECVICTSEVVRTSRVWSCSICWTVAHLHCVKKWHTNQMKKQEEEQNQNPNASQPPGWRCPGCNSSLVEKPGPHNCWCGKETDPRPIPGLPPHTCGQTCSKTRATCPHPCPLMCHAGPCPPCTLMGPMQTCFCGKHTSTRKCIETDYGKGFSCREVCGDLLPCGEHTCSQLCHTGLCGACEVPVVATCYCGKEQRNIPCDQRDEISESFNYGQVKPSEPSGDLEEWFEGSFNCKKVCGRSLDCGHHTCQRPCHAQDEEPAHCPLSPDIITTCPCGKTPLTSLTTEPRQSCQDPIPYCDKTCNKTLPCGHSCPQKCHDGPCPNCEQVVNIACRCGRTTEEVICHEGTQEQPQCTRVCRVQRNCGRHECGTVCCQGEKKAAERKKQQKKGAGNNNNHDNFEAEHICLQVCGRQLKCGKHACQQLCHRGPCHSCPEAIFDEISCSCGRTVLQPPQPCGTRPPECRFPCRRARPCGHPAVAHQCHPDEVACPKCPFLVEKACICGKKTLKNQPCWFDEVRCGLPCGKKLKCGAHECKKSCHRPRECEDAGIPGSHCSQLCGRVRKSCEHTCQEQCHAPLPCKEDKPCPSKTFITCPCQHRKQEVRCLATKLNPREPSSSPSLKCDDECLRLQRNRRLADALNIDPETHKDDHVPYSETTLKLYRENIPWAQSQEREFRVFTSPSEEEKRLRFKPMPAHQRAFIHALAEDYGLDSESQDPEPHRHVCIFKTPRFVGAPRKTLGQCVKIATAKGASASALVAAEQQKLKLWPFNSLLLRGPRFGLTIDEIDKAIAGDLRSEGGDVLQVGLLTVGVGFVTRFLPESGDEVVITAVPAAPSIAAVATGSGGSSAAAAPTPLDKAVEGLLVRLRLGVGRSVSGLGLASKNVVLCRVEESPAGYVITRREGDGGAGLGSGGGDKGGVSAGGWSAVASRGGWKRGGGVSGTGTNTSSGGSGGVSVSGLGRSAPGRSFVALLRKKKREPSPEPEPELEEVEDDWLVAAEKVIGGERGVVGVEGEGKEVVEVVDEGGEVVDGKEVADGKVVEVVDDGKEVVEVDDNNDEVEGGSSGGEGDGGKKNLNEGEKKKGEADEGVEGGGVEVVSSVSSVSAAAA